MPQHFADLLCDAIDRIGSPACVGIDPVYEKLPASLKADGDEPEARVRAISRFSDGVIEAVTGQVAAVKLQSACFERYGSAGVAALEQAALVARRAGLVVILDAKRGDIGVTAEHYAFAAFGGTPRLGDALTVNGYLGMETIEPFLQSVGPCDSEFKPGVFVLVRTSNPGSDQIQSIPTSRSRTFSEHMAGVVADLGARFLARCGMSAVGAVVGATKGSEAAALRDIMPSQYFLVPGYGAQGGTIADLKAMVRREARSPGQLGVLVTASRSVIYPSTGSATSWQVEVRDAAVEMARELGHLADNHR